ACDELQSSGWTQDTETDKKRDRGRGEQLEAFVKVQRIENEKALGKIPAVDAFMEEAQKFLVAGMMELSGRATHPEESDPTVMRRGAANKRQTTKLVATMIKTPSASLGPDLQDTAAR